MITLAQYLGPYARSASVTPEIMVNAQALLSAVDGVLQAAKSDGVKLHVNPVTGSFVSGDGNGGFRVPTVAVGAPQSKHKTGHAVDVYDPHRELASWAWRNRPLVANAGLHIERPEWTPTWVHFQNVAPGSGVFAFIPNNNPPLAAKLPEQDAA